MEKSINNVRDSLRPLIWLNNLFGFMIIQMPLPSIIYRPISFLISLIRLTLYGFVLWYGMYRILKKQFIILIIFVALKVIIFINVITLIFATVFSFKNHENMNKFAEKITLADETLAIFGIDPEYEASFKEHVRMVMKWLLISIVIFNLNIVMYYHIFNDLSDAIIFITALECPLVLNPIIELNFLTFIKIIGKRFERLNALTQSISISPLQIINSRQLDKYMFILNKNQNKVEVRSKNYSRNRSNIGLVLKVVRQIHLDLCEISREMNDAFSKHLTMQIGATFVLLTGFSYCIYIVTKEQDMSLTKRIMHYGVFGMWNLASIIKTIRVVRASTDASLEAERTSQIAHEIQLARWQKKFTDEIHQLSLQIMQRPLYFTAGHMIVLDFSYVRGFLGSVTTYFMILITNQSDMIKAARGLTNIGNSSTSSNDI